MAFRSIFYLTTYDHSTILYGIYWDSRVVDLVVDWWCMDLWVCGVIALLFRAGSTHLGKRKDRSLLTSYGFDTCHLASLNGLHCWKETRFSCVGVDSHLIRSYVKAKNPIFPVFDLVERGSISS